MSKTEYCSTQSRCSVDRIVPVFVMGVEAVSSCY